jgi:hypothetical protein
VSSAPISPDRLCPDGRSATPDSDDIGPSPLSRFLVRRQARDCAATVKNGAK